MIQVKSKTDKHLEEQVKIAQKFSPTNDTFPKDFTDWFSLQETTLGQQVMMGVFANTVIPKGMVLGEYKGKRSFSKPSKDKKFDDPSYVLRTIIRDKQDNEQAL